MAQLVKGFTFQDGTSGNAAQLNSLVDNGTVASGIIGDQADAVITANDRVLFLQSSTNTLKSRAIDAIIVDRLPLDGPPSVFSLRRLGTGPQNAAPGNDARFPAQITGIRKANNTAADTVAKAQDLVIAPFNLNGATAIDWRKSTTFYDTLSANRTFSLTNGVVGQTITVVLKFSGGTHTITFTGANIATVGSGTTYAQCTMTSTPFGVTGYCVYI